MHVRVRTALFFYSFNFNRGCGGVDYSRTFVVYSRTCGVSGNTRKCRDKTEAYSPDCYAGNNNSKHLDN